jgi:AraC family transcriptional regulator
MWETYLSDPTVEPDPATWRTEIVWPLHPRS